MFGELLLAKIVVFSLMVLSATFVTLFIGPRLRKLVHNRKAAALTPGSRTFTLDNLKAFDGKEDAGSIYSLSWPCGIGRPTARNPI
ncbi:hypothetical protein BMS3Abin14_00124 [bacterium BMS3Abin14]|nr:hypothetical protein BMS3Abin14_00124 [bacterium BMS3Abin14]